MAVQICGGFVLHARSDPWHVLNPQVIGPGVSAGAVVGIEVWTGVGVTFPPEVSVQPAAMSAATSNRPYITGMRTGCFMNDQISCDIRHRPYLWVYFAAKILGVMVILVSLSLTPWSWAEVYSWTGIIF